nr:hypothetical protein [Tanacetum cinerariifolium]
DDDDVLFLYLLLILFDASGWSSNKGQANSFELTGSTRTCPQCGMTLFNGICDNCIYGAGMPIIFTECGGIVRGGLCLPCDLIENNLYNYDPNAYSFNNSNYFPQSQDENYLCNLCGNNSHDDYDCQQQFPFVYEQEPSYNQNYDDNYYPHESLSFPCCDYCGGSHETFQCQPDNQNVDFSGSDQIQTLQYLDVNPLSPEIKYDQSTSTDRPIFLNDNVDHPVQNEESPENSSKENVVSKTNQEPPQDSDIHQLIEECSIKVPEQLKQKMENTMFELVKIYQEKECLCIHDDVDDLIESALDSKLLLINSNSQRPDKQEQEVKNIVEQPAKHGNRNIQSLQNFRVIHKSSISVNSTSRISSIHLIAPILSTKEPEHLLSMGYEHLSITPETESDEVIESNAENLLPIPSKCEVTLEDEIECGMPAKDDCSLVFTTFSNPPFKDNVDLDSSDDESLPDEDVPAEEFQIYSNPLCDENEINSDKLDSHCFSVEYDFVESLLNHDTFIDFSSKFDFSGELAHIKPEIPKFNFDFEEEIHDVLPPSIENFADDPGGDIRFLKELLINDSILSDELSDANFEENPSIPRPPSKPPDVETDAGEEIPVVMNDKDEDVNYSSFIFVIYPEMFLFLLSAESEDTIFDPGLSPMIEAFLCWICVRFPRSSHPSIKISLGKFISF